MTLIRSILRFLLFVVQRRTRCRREERERERETVLVGPELERDGFDTGRFFAAVWWRWYGVRVLGLDSEAS